MTYRLEICTPLREFFQFLVTCPNVPQPVTFEDALEELNRLHSSQLGPLLKQQAAGHQHVAKIMSFMQVDLTVLIGRNPQPVFLKDYLAHHFFIQDAWPN